MKRRFALITVNDKTGLREFASGLRSLGYEFVASKMCAKLLRKWGINVVEAAKVTGFPPIMGRQGIKLIHPKIFGGILADPSKKRHREDLKKYHIKPFEIVACNFYPFEKIISVKGHRYEKAITNIDIGGPAMVRCAAKNYKNVAVVVHPSDYGKVLGELRANGKVSLKTKEELALKAFRRTEEYDRVILKYLSAKFT
jgi:phosphoribosylaminoimidazolecarboxamide formyltransferase/IMP cyclohydrolase